MNQELLDYVKNSKETGLNEEEIRKNLLSTGWTNQDIDEAFKVVSSPAINVVPNMIYPNSSIVKPSFLDKSDKEVIPEEKNKEDRNFVVKKESFFTKHKKKLFIVGIILFLVVVAVVYFLINKNSNYTDTSNPMPENSNLIPIPEIPVNENTQQETTPISLTITDEQKESSPDKVFISYMEELYEAKDFDEQILIKKKYESKRAISELEKDISQGKYSQPSDKEGVFALYTTVSGFFYKITKTQIDGSMVNIEASVRTDFSSSKIEEGQLIKSKMILEDNLWKIDTLSIGGGIAF